ncbi:MAG TPA: hypothetical protein VMZ05_10220 [Spirochaetota bacterium]|nr:hypothetical protein [Spirochaetota bacterium]
MRRIAIVALAVLFVVTGVFGYRAVFRAQSVAADEVRMGYGREEGEFMLAQAVTKPQQDKGQWVAKVDDTVISFADFEREFNVHVLSLPIDDGQKKKYVADSNNKKKFLVNLINEYLIYKRALKEKYDRRSDVQDLIKAVTRRAIIQVYLNEKIEPQLSEIPDEQIETIYNQNKKLFAGVDIDIARQQIRMQLLQKQYNELLNDLIDSLKGEAKVVKNSDLDL